MHDPEGELASRFCAYISAYILATEWPRFFEGICMGRRMYAVKRVPSCLKYQRGCDIVTVEGAMYSCPEMRSGGVL